MELPAVFDAVRAALLQSAAALNRAYPKDLPHEELSAHADDLLNRYCNRALGDTLHRVGRDLGRKLAREDRLIGACLLAAKHGLPFDSLVPPIRAALKFAAPDEQGRVGEADQRILQAVAERGPRAVLGEIAGLDAGQSMDQRVLHACFP